MTLVEVTIAMTLATTLSAGLYLVGLKLQRFTDYGRLSTEARALAIERLEEMRAMGSANLSLPTCTLLNSDTNTSVQGLPIIRTPYVQWHGNDGQIVGVSSSLYAEATVEVSYASFVANNYVTNSFSMLFR